MQEFTTAMAELTAIMNAKKAEIAEQFRPIFQSSFAKFFDENPEIDTIGFRVATDIYDDENYSEGIEDVRYGLREDIDPSESMHHVEDGPLMELSDWPYKTARGEFDHWSQNYYSAERKAQMIEEAKKTVADHEAFVETVTPERFEALQEAVAEARETIEGIDIEFHKIVFGEDVEVEISRDDVIVTGK